MNEKKFRKGQKVRVSYEATITSDKPGSRVGWPCSWVRVDAMLADRESNPFGSTTSASLQVPVDFIEPIADPASDPVGTVRKYKTSHHGELVMVRMAQPHDQFDDLYWCSVTGPTSNSWNGDEVMVGSEIIGAVPGTPAWEVSHRDTPAARRG